MRRIPTRRRRKEEKSDDRVGGDWGRVKSESGVGLGRSGRWKTEGIRRGGRIRREGEDERRENRKRRRRRRRIEDRK